MNRRGAGVVFCVIAAICFLGRYLCAAIYLMGGSTWSAELYESGLRYVGDSLLYVSGIALIVGIVYLILAEAEYERNKQQNLPEMTTEPEQETAQDQSDTSSGFTPL